MRVVTYFEPLPGHPDGLDLIQRWRQNWAANGWRPEVLSEVDARRHPWFGEYDRWVSSLPTVNHRAYEVACWRRWLAYAVKSEELGLPIMAVDADVFNNEWRCRPIPTGLTFFGMHCTPACAGDAAAFNSFAYAVLNDAAPGLTRINGRMHLSDMTLAEAMQPIVRWPIRAVMAEYPSTTSPLIHISTRRAAEAGKSKIAIWDSLKLNITKEWFHSRAHLEEGLEIGAGSLKQVETPISETDLTKASEAESLQTGLVCASPHSSSGTHA